MAQKLIDDFDGEVPKTIAELITLPGVARKTANVVQLNLFPEVAHEGSRRGHRRRHPRGPRRGAAWI